MKKSILLLLLSATMLLSACGSTTEPVAKGAKASAESAIAGATKDVVLDAAEEVMVDVVPETEPTEEVETTEEVEVPAEGAELELNPDVEVTYDEETGEAVFTVELPEADPSTFEDVKLEVPAVSGPVEVDTSNNDPSFIEMQKNYPYHDEYYYNMDIHGDDIDLGGEFYFNGSYTKEDTHTTFRIDEWNDVYGYDGGINFMSHWYVDELGKCIIYEDAASWTVSECGEVCPIAEPVKYAFQSLYDVEFVEDQGDGFVIYKGKLNTANAPLLNLYMTDREYVDVDIYTQDGQIRQVHSWFDAEEEFMVNGHKINECSYSLSATYEDQVSYVPDVMKKENGFVK